MDSTALGLRILHFPRFSFHLIHQILVNRYGLPRHRFIGMLNPFRVVPLTNHDERMKCWYKVTIERKER